MRVFLDTNVLVSAFATRGLCADVVRHVLAEHQLITGEVVLEELRRVLRDRIQIPTQIIAAIEQFLRDQAVVPKPAEPAALPLRDIHDRWILASAVDGEADVLVTGDQDLLALGADAPLPVLNPRGFWSLAREGRASDK